MNLPEAVALITAPLVRDRVEHFIRFGEWLDSATVTAFDCGEPFREWSVFIDADGDVNILVQDPASEPIG